MCATRRDGEGAAARVLLRATLVGLHPTWAFAEPSGRRALSKMMRLQEAERCRAEPVAGSNRRILPRSEAQKRSMSGSRKVHMWVAHDAKGRERTLVGEQRTCMVTILCSRAMLHRRIRMLALCLPGMLSFVRTWTASRQANRPTQRGQGMAARRGMKALSACGALRRCFVAAHAQQQARRMALPNPQRL